MTTVKSFGTVPDAEHGALLSVMDCLRAASRRLPDDRCTSMCLDTLLHVGHADGGVLIDASGAIHASHGLSEGQVAELTAIAIAPFMRDASPVHVHLMDATVCATRFQLRACGEHVGTIVLTSPPEDPFGPDLFGFVPMLSFIAEEMRDRVWVTTSASPCGHTA